MSSSEIAISIRGLSKAYTITHNALRRPTFRDVVMDRLRHPFRRAQRETLWALKDVSLDVKQGEVLGVIGRNGAGKSTLLKILSRITEPTAGEVRLYGRVGSLLEVGTGFHPELTGRENIYLNGAILGMTRPEIRKQFDAIVAFSEIEKFLDTPVKRYSSGMYVRLAFAVSAHLDFDILLVDEVLSVGDVTFQRKCVGKMQEVSSRGKTVLLVTHNMDLIHRYADRAVFLEAGRVSYAGSRDEGVRRYLAPAATGTPQVPCGDGRFLLQDARVISGAVAATHEPIVVCLEFEIQAPCADLRIGFDVLSERGDIVFRSYHNDMASERHSLPPGRYQLQATVPPDLLRPGRYYLSVEAGVHCVEMIVTKMLFGTVDVVLTNGVDHLYGGHNMGAVMPMVVWQIVSLKGVKQCPGG